MASEPRTPAGRLVTAFGDVEQMSRLYAPEIEWTRIIRSRHIVVHDYFGVDYEIIWRIVQVHLPPLRASLQTLQQRLSPRDPDAR